MTVIVTDSGFGPIDWTGAFHAFDGLQANDCGGLALDLPSDFDPNVLRDGFERFAMIRVDFPNFADGRGFTIAAQLRALGYKGRLRARGHVIADQYAMARRSGFDEVEIGADLAARQPQAQWLARANWRANDYQSRLRG